MRRREARKGKLDPAGKTDVSTALSDLFTKITALENNLSRLSSDLFGNQNQLKMGLDSAEFNLRAHQKVLNSLALDVANVSETTHVELVELESGEKKETRINWPLYHKHVEEDLKFLREQELKIRTEQADKISAGLPTLREQLVKRAESSEEKVEAVSRFIADLEKEIQSVKSGKAYDGSKLDQATRMLAAIKAEEQASVPAVAEDTNVTVFGG